MSVPVQTAQADCEAISSWAKARKRPGRTPPQSGVNDIAAALVRPLLLRAPPGARELSNAGARGLLMKLIRHPEAITLTSALDGFACGAFLFARDSGRARRHLRGPTRAGESTSAT
jgi:hypothetical protein